MGLLAQEIVVPAGAHKWNVFQRTAKVVRLWRRADKQGIKGISFADPCQLVAIQQRLT